jgi:hypothetical protein
MHRAADAIRKLHDLHMVILIVCQRTLSANTKVLKTGCWKLDLGLSLENFALPNLFLRKHIATTSLSKGIIIFNTEMSPKRAQYVLYLNGYYPVSEKYCASFQFHALQNCAHGEQHPSPALCVYSVLVMYSIVQARMTMAASIWILGLSIQIRAQNWPQCTHLFDQRLRLSKTRGSGLPLVQDCFRLQTRPARA